MDSFLNLRPKIEIILNIDSDHLDYFKDIDHIVNSFDKFAKLVPEDGLIVAYEANPFVNQVIKKLDNAVTFGLNENCTYGARQRGVQRESGMPAFDVKKEGRHPVQSAAFGSRRTQYLKCAGRFCLLPQLRRPYRSHKGDSGGIITVLRGALT